VALAALAIVVFGAIECPSILNTSLKRYPLTIQKKGGVQLKRFLLWLREASKISKGGRVCISLVVPRTASRVCVPAHL